VVSKAREGKIRSQTNEEGGERAMVVGPTEGATRDRKGEGIVQGQGGFKKIKFDQQVQA